MNQLIRYNETTAALIAVPFTTVDKTNVQTRLNGTTLPNSNLRCYIKKGGVTTAVAGAGTFTGVDDTNALGCREYIPAAGELPVGVSTLRFYDTGALMEPREIDVMVVYEDPYKPAYYGAAVTGTLTATSFTSNRTETATDSFKNALIEFLEGPAVAAPMPIGSYDGTTKKFTLAGTYAFPAAPVNGNKFRIITC